MVGEALAAAVVGLAVLWLVLQPLVRPSARRPAATEPVDPEETPKGIALTALKEIEFDRETGKLSEADYEFLKAEYTRAALEALRLDSEGDTSGEVGSDDVEAMIAARVRTFRSASAGPPSNPPANLPFNSQMRPPSAPVCPACGPRPEPDALFCSTCGRRLPDRAVSESPVASRQSPSPASSRQPPVASF